MKALTLKAPGGLNNIHVSDIADPGQPGKGEIRVAIKAGSLNFSRSDCRYRAVSNRRRPHPAV